MTFAVWKDTDPADLVCSPNPWVTGGDPAVAIAAFLDSFTDVNLTQLIAHTAEIQPAGSAWVVLIGAATNFFIFNNRAVVQDVNVRTLIAHDTGLSDFTFTFQTDMNFSVDIAAYFRVLDADNWWSLDMTNNSGGAWALVKSVGGVKTTLDSASSTGQIGIIKLKITCQGSSILVEDLTNSIQLSADDSDLQTETFVGLGENDDSTSTQPIFDDFLVETIP